MLTSAQKKEPPLHQFFEKRQSRTDRQNNQRGVLGPPRPIHGSADLDTKVPNVCTTGSATRLGSNFPSNLWTRTRSVLEGRRRHCAQIGHKKSLLCITSIIVITRCGMLVCVCTQLVPVRCRWALYEARFSHAFCLTASPSTDYHLSSWAVRMVLCTISISMVSESNSNFRKVCLLEANNKIFQKETGPKRSQLPYQLWAHTC